MRPVSALRGLHGAVTPHPVPPYGLYTPAPFLPYGQGIPYGPNGASTMNAPQHARATPQIILQVIRAVIKQICNL